MTISKGPNLTITTGVTGPESTAAFSSSQAGVVYGKPGAGGIASGFLLDISGTTVSKAGAQADLHTATTSPFQFVMISPVSLTTLHMLTVDNSANPVAEVTPITKTATQLVGGSPLALSTPTDVDNGQIHSIFSFGSDSLCTLLDTTQAFWYLTLSDGSSQGNVVTFNPTPAAGSLMMGFAQFDSTSGVLCYFQGTSFDYVGLPLSKSGLTLTAGTPFTINTTNISFSGLAPMAACQVKSGRILAGYIDTNSDKNLQTIDTPTTINANTIIAASAADCWLERFHAGSAVIFGDTGVTCDWSEVTIAGAGGLTHTNTVAGSGTGANNARGAMSRLDNSHIIAIFSGSGTMLAAVLTTDVVPPGISNNEFTSGLLTARPVGIDMDGSFIYISALASDGTPILIKFSTALNTDGSIVFQPGAGDDIGVQCGKKDADVIWIAGNFGGTDTVEKSEDAGASFVVKDDGSFDPVTSFAVGPDSDERVLIFTDAGGSVASASIYETIDDGALWEQKNSGLGFVSKAVERLDINVEELVTGNESSATDNIDYSPNSGEDLEDYSTGFPEVDVTSLVVG